ncbi:hypothetical protein [Micromonospora marina]|uniref:Tetratricopeptide repeat-containing protein n=1 Tax=Micromonospora marina TaxID=307120 RepID=A0A1C5A1W1_9ACTN|nr:hypothetical protein [Micromonospora marina]SCF39173.1 hypothetical protein GA0070215_12343 [Micromonospora marina]
MVQADSRGNPAQAARILDGALTRPEAADDPAVQVEALVYRAGLALQLDEPDSARELVRQARSIPLDDGSRDALADTLRHAEDLIAALPPA